MLLLPEVIVPDVSGNVLLLLLLLLLKMMLLTGRVRQRQRAASARILAAYNLQICLKLRLFEFSTTVRNIEAAKASLLAAHNFQIFQYFSY